MLGGVEELLDSVIAVDAPVRHEKLGETESVNAFLGRRVLTLAGGG